MMEKITNVLGQLVGFDTSDPGQLSAIFDYIADYLQQYGITSVKIPNREHNTYSLLASFRTGKPEAPSVLLSAHVDVVTTKQQIWQHDPFQLTIQEDYCYARGVVDMKGFIACELAMLAEMIQQPVNLILVFTNDEETSCQSIQDVCQYLQSQSIPINLAIVGEPTGGIMYNSCKGVSEYQLTVQGVACHSSQPQYGHNAILAAVQTIQLLQEQLHSVAAPDLTANVGLIQGGSAPNIVPSDCRWSFDLRSFSQATVEQIINDLQQPWQQVARELGVKIELQTVCRILPLRNGFTHMPTAVYNAATEAGYYQALGIPTVIYGPGSLQQAHRADEFITKSDLQQYQQFLANLAPEVTKLLHLL